MVICNLNVPTSTTLSYPLLIITGTCSNPTKTVYLTHKPIKNSSSQEKEQEQGFKIAGWRFCNGVSFPARGGCFKMLVHLEEGDNLVWLWEKESNEEVVGSGGESVRGETEGLDVVNEVDNEIRNGNRERGCSTNTDILGGRAVKLQLRYDNAAGSRRGQVRLVYLLANDKDGSFQGPEFENTTQESGIKRLKVAGRLIQSAMAHMMHTAGFGRITFNLDEDVVIHRLEQNFEELKKMDDHCLYCTVYKALQKQKSRKHGKENSTVENDDDDDDDDRCIDIAIMSFTRYDASQSKVFCHTALGAYPLALFGGASLHCWPQSIAEIVPRFCDTRVLDTKQFFDDSNGRSQRWALLSTTMGAVLHELGHAFGLRHPTLRTAERGGVADVMSRGFDHFNRLFVAVEGNKCVQELGNVPIWERSAALQLSVHPMISSHDGIRDSNFERLASLPKIDVAFCKKENNISVDCDAGICTILYYVDDDIADHDEQFDMKDKCLSLGSKEQLKRRFKIANNQNLVVNVIDRFGQSKECNISD